MPKTDYIGPYFDQRKEDLSRAEVLLKDPKYYLESILILSCHIGGLGSFRFPTLPDNEAYKRVVLEYSGMESFYNQIDLLFFLQWPRSDYRNHGLYRNLKNHSEISNVIKTTYGDEDNIKNGTRYVSPEAFLSVAEAGKIDGFDKQNLEQHLPLFSNIELLYRYVRCKAVHNVHFPFVNRVHVVNNGIRYEDNHAINGRKLHETVLAILGNLKDACMQAGKWPSEL